jgi:hypothetical protein
MSGRKKKSTKKQKTVARVEKTVPNFDNVHRSIRDSYALICVGYQLILEKDDRYAVVLLQKGVKLLGEARNSFAQANSRLLDFCQDNNISQENKQEQGSAS